MRRKAVIILGMHRSGTSAFAGVLSLMGVNFGKNMMQPAFDNEKGYFENKNIFNVNEAILSTLDSSWDSLLPLPQNWWLVGRLDIYKRLIRDIIREEFSTEEIFAVKDPRISRLFPLWQAILDDLNIEYHFIIPVRNPLEVSLSLERRNNFSLEKGAILWTTYNIEAEHYSRKYSRIILSYNELLEHPEKFIQSMAEKLNIDCPKDVSTAMDDINNFLDPTLKNHDFNLAFEDKRLFNYVFKLYQSLLDLSDGGSDDISCAVHIVDELASEFIAMRNYFYTPEMQRELKNTLMLRHTLEKLRETERQLQQIEQGIRKMKNSLSWRITAPLRSAKAYFKRIVK